MDHTQQRADRQRRSDLEPRVELLPCPAVHADLAAATALALANQHGATTGIQIGLAEIKRLADPQPGPPQDDDQRTQASTICQFAGCAHDSDDLLNGRRGQLDDAALRS